MAKNKRCLSEVFPEVFPVFLERFPGTRGCLKVLVVSKNTIKLQWIWKQFFHLSEEAQEAIASYSLDSELVILWPSGGVEVVAYK